MGGPGSLCCAFVFLTAHHAELQTNGLFSTVSQCWPVHQHNVAWWPLQVFWFALPRPAPADAQLALELYSSRDNK
jgi:hypothetical protein